MKKVKLICTSESNNNKYYHMEQIDDSTFQVKYGRIGVTEQIETYDISKWDSIYKKKTTRKNNPYHDVTELFIDQKISSEFKEISSSIIRRIINDLQTYAKQSITDNYTVSSASVTEKQVNVAQEIVDKIATKTKVGESVKEVNILLLELYRTIPRKIKKVQEHLVQNGENIVINTGNLDFLKSIVTEEQSTLDVMRGQVQLNIPQDQENKQFTLLDSLGLQAEEVSDIERNEIVQLLSDSKHYFSSAIKLINVNTQNKFNEWLEAQNNKERKFLWHGSRSQNWLNIVKTGLLIRPSNAIASGSLFNDGIYFAPRAKKSIGYTSLENSYWAGGNSKKAFLAVYDVHVGNSLFLKENDRFDRSTGHSFLKSKGHDSLWVKKGYQYGGYNPLQNDEVIVYKKEQCTIKYLVEIKSN